MVTLTFSVARFADSSSRQIGIIQECTTPHQSPGHTYCYLLGDYLLGV